VTQTFRRMATRVREPTDRAARLVLPMGTAGEAADKTSIRRPGEEPAEEEGVSVWLARTEQVRHKGRPDTAETQLATML
jgi:hypothetical protein